MTCDLLLPRRCLSWISLLLLSSQAIGHTNGVVPAGFCRPIRDAQCPYIICQKVEPRSARGCWSQHRTPKGQEVHVLSWSGGAPPPPVWLSLLPREPPSSHSDNIFLVLHSDSGPLSWTLSEERILSTKITVLVQVGSDVSWLGSRRPVVREFNSTSLPHLLVWIKEKRLRAITTFTKVQDVNTLSLRVGTEPLWGSSCDVESEAESPSVVASSSIPVPSLFSCNHPTTIATQKRIIYVLELLQTSEKNVTLQVELEEASLTAVNLILVLKSHSPIKWILKAFPSLRGSILIVSDEVVSAKNIPPLLEVKAQLADVPLSGQTQQLVDWTQKHYGPVASFTSAHNADLVRIILPVKKQDVFQMQGDASKVEKEEEPSVSEASAPVAGFPYHMHPSSQQQNASVLPGWPKNLTIVSIKMTNSTVKSSEKVPKINAKINLTRQLALHMSWQCLEKTVVITFRKEGVEEALHTPEGALLLTLRNRNCTALLNATHYVLSYPLTSCGSQRKEKSHTNAYTNQVFFWRQYPSQHSLATEMRDESEQDGEREENEEELRLHDQPALLHFMNFQGNCNTSLQYPDDNIEDGGESNSFRMELFRNKDFSGLISAKSYPFETVEYNFIFVEASMRTTADSNLCASIEDCWLADTVSSQSESSKRSVLIRNSCPSDLSVQFLNASRVQPCRRRFSFQLNGDFMEQNVYLHCRLVTCQKETNSSINNLPGIRKCSDPEEFCISQSLRPFLDAPHYIHSSIEVCGPIRVVPKHKACKDKEALSSGGSWHRSSASARSEKPTIVMVGLPTEAVVGVAIASFLIGAGLTALLWFIHNRTDPSRMVRASGQPKTGSHHLPCPPVHQHAGYDLSGHSGSSTPSSQAPMTFQVKT